MTRESLGGSTSSSRTGSASSRTSSVNSLASGRPSRASLSAHPGRATRQSSHNLTADDSDVFKAPTAAAHTPGRQKIIFFSKASIFLNRLIFAELELVLKQLKNQY